MKGVSIVFLFYHLSQTYTSQPTGSVIQNNPYYV